MDGKAKCVTNPGHKQTYASQEQHPVRLVDSISQQVVTIVNPVNFHGRINQLPLMLQHRMFAFTLMK